MIQQRRPSWPCEAWPSDLIFFPDTCNDLVTFPLVVPVSSPLLPEGPISSEWFRGDHDPWPPPRFPVTHPRIPRGGIRNYAIRILAFLESRILGTQPLRLPLEYFYIFGTVPVDRNIRNFLQECKIKRIRWNFASQIFSTGFISSDVFLFGKFIRPKFRSNILS